MVPINICQFFEFYAFLLFFDVLLFSQVNNNNNWFSEWLQGILVFFWKFMNFLNC